MALEGIFNYLESPVSPYAIRPFPKEETQLVGHMREEMEQVAREIATLQVEEIKQHYQKVKG
ncbi:MAG: hypothetical protein ACQEWI_00175 [Bacillota bacterium]